MKRASAASPGLSLKARAIALLAQREHSSAELRRKLLRLAQQIALARVNDEALPASPPDEEAVAEEVEALLAWLQAQGYLDEARFVESRVHARSGRWGQQRIAQELAQHGLSLSAEQREALAASELQRARDIWQRKFGGQAPVTPADKARQLRFLLGRGFSAALVQRLWRSTSDE